jgi:hypothetical protein
VAHFFDLQLSPDQRDDVMRSHSFRFIDEQDAVRSRT